MMRGSLISASVLPLSQSPVWQQQRAFYEDRASEAFAEIPHQAVDNPWVAAAYARVIAGFLRDSALDPSEPVYVLELGAGAGRFAHGLARELGERDFVYVLTDFAESQLDDWEHHAGLEDERFDFARVDLTQPIAPALRRRGITLERVANPLVVVANYVFDSIPADAFAVAGGSLRACLVDQDFTFTQAPVTPYGDEDLEALLEHYRVTLDDTVFTLPTVALRAIRGLREVAGDRLLVLAADKALSTEEALAYREAPEPARHGGAFSLMVNFHALGYVAARHGGELLHGGDRHAAIDVGALVFGGGAQTREAYRDAIERFGPGDLATLLEGVERAAAQLSVAEIVALLRLSGWDASTLFEIEERHFTVPGDPDLPFAIGLLLYELQDYEDAIAYFEASLEQHGHDPATEKNIELCEAMLS
jgi:tetratricopeptide (TPR) repeat protein